MTTGPKFFLQKDYDAFGIEERDGASGATTGATAYSLYLQCQSDGECQALYQQYTIYGSSL